MQAGIGYGAMVLASQTDDPNRIEKLACAIVAYQSESEVIPDAETEQLLQLIEQAEQASEEVCLIPIAIPIAFSNKHDIGFIITPDSEWGVGTISADRIQEILDTDYTDADKDIKAMAEILGIELHEEGIGTFIALDNDDYTYET